MSEIDYGTAEACSWTLAKRADVDAKEEMAERPGSGDGFHCEQGKKSEDDLLVIVRSTESWNSVSVYKITPEWNAKPT